MKKEDVLRYFRTEGLLVRTVQLKNLGDNFNDICVPVEDFPNYQKRKETFYGPKRKWSFAHPDIKPMFYMFDSKSSLCRHLAIMVVPSLVGWDRYMAISEKDESTSSSIGEKDKLIGPAAEKLYKDTLDSIRGMKPDAQNQNSEVSTFGFCIGAFCGLLFHGEMEWLNKNYSEIKEKLGVLKRTYNIESVDIYKYNEITDKTSLECLDDKRICLP